MALVLGVLAAPVLVLLVIAMVLRYEVWMKVSKAEKAKRDHPHWADLRQEDEQDGQA